MRNYEPYRTELEHTNLINADVTKQTRCVSGGDKDEKGHPHNYGHSIRPRAQRALERRAERADRRRPVRISAKMLRRRGISYLLTTTYLIPPARFARNAVFIVLIRFKDVFTVRQRETNVSPSFALDNLRAQSIVANGTCLPRRHTHALRIFSRTHETIRIAQTVSSKNLSISHNVLLYHITCCCIT